MTMKSLEMPYYLRIVVWSVGDNRGLFTSEL